MKHYCLHIPADLNLSSSVRKIAVQIFQNIGFDAIAASRLKLVFDEIFMNAVRYGSVEGSSVYINFDVEDQVLKVTFEDEGGENKVTPEALKEIISHQETNTNLSKTSGRGLAQITQEWADGLHIWNGKKGGLAISFSKRLPQAGDAPEADVSQSIENAQTTTDIVHLPRQVIALQGEIDNSNLEEQVQVVEDFMQKLSAAYLLILDMQAVQFINSTFLAKVAGWKQSVGQYGGELVIQNVQPDILEIFELVGMTKLVPIASGEFPELANSQ